MIQLLILARPLRSSALGAAFVQPVARAPANLLAHPDNGRLWDDAPSPQPDFGVTQADAGQNVFTVQGAMAKRHLASGVMNPLKFMQRLAADS